MFQVEDKQAIQGIDLTQLADRYQNAVIDGCTVSINSGTLGNTDTLAVASGNAIVDGGTVSVSSQDVQIDAAHSTNPRKDVVYIDSNGDAQVENGTPEGAVPSAVTRFDTHRPAPSDMTGTTGAVLEEVWVPAGASSITSDDLRGDRQLGADAAFGSVGAEQASIGHAELGPLALVTNTATRLGINGAQQPHGVYIPSENKTFVVFGGSSDDPFATYYDHDGRVWGPQTRIGTNPLSDSDDHGSPSVSITSSGTIVVLYGAHSSTFQVALSDNPYDTTAWTTDEATGIPVGTYPSQTIHNGNPWVIYRPGDSHDGTYPGHEYGTIANSTDDGATWSDVGSGPQVDLTGHPDTTQDFYIHSFVEDDGLLWFGFNVAHGSGHDGDRGHVFVCYYDPSDGNVYAPDDTSFGTTATWSELSGSAAQAISQTSGVNGASLAIENSEPRTLYSRESSGQSQWEVASWSSGSWSTEQIGSLVKNGRINDGDIRFNSEGDIEAHIPTGDGTSLSDHAPSNYTVATKSGGVWGTETLIHNSVSAVHHVGIPAAATDDFRSLVVEYSDTQENCRIWASGALSQANTVSITGGPSGGPILKTWTYNDADADSRLDSALFDASDGDKILLENTAYDSTRTISEQVHISGTAGNFPGGTRIGGDWTIDTPNVSLSDVEVQDSASITVGQQNFQLTGFAIQSGASIQINHDNARIANGNGGGSITFDSGTSNGIVDTLAGNLTVTDNGSNTVGDVA